MINYVKLFFEYFFDKVEFPKNKTLELSLGKRKFISTTDSTLIANIFNDQDVIRGIDAQRIGSKLLSEYNLVTLSKDDDYFNFLNDFIFKMSTDKEVHERFVLYFSTNFKPKTQYPINGYDYILRLVTKSFLYAVYRMKDVDLDIVGDMITRMDDVETNAMLYGWLRTKFGIIDRFAKELFPKFDSFLNNQNRIVDYVWSLDSSEESYLTKLKQYTINGFLTKNHAKETIKEVLLSAKTLALSISWTLYHLSKNKEHIDLCKTSLEFSRNCYKEALRLNPPFHIATYQKGKCPFTKTEYVIPILGVHLSEDNFNNPTKFDPYRFDTMKDLTNKWIPFGGGDRICPGRGMSIKVGPEIIKTILNKFTVDVFETVTKREFHYVPKNEQMDMVFR